MHIAGINNYAGVGINLFDVAGVEVQAEAIGLSGRIKIGRFSIATSGNLVGSTSISFEWETEEDDDGGTKTKGFTIGTSSIYLGFAAVTVLGFIYTGSYIPILALA